MNFRVKIMKKLLVLLAVACISLPAAAQKYTYGIGARVSYGIAADFRWNFNQRNSLEAMADITPWWGGITLTALYEWNFDLGNPFSGGEGFNLYTGPGLHIGMRDWNNPGLAFGVDGIVGVEYKFGIPLAVGLDYKPAIGFYSGSGKMKFDWWSLYSFGASVRYTF